ncbi:MAG: hypothetical protein M1127_00995, partial [Patescibacteria group bacterium]|nr:hypothetical protein [Patescibacteria group bacterium]
MKTFVCVFVLLNVILLPVQALAFSAADVSKFLNKIMAKIQVPDEIGLTPTGGIRMGSSADPNKNLFNFDCLTKQDKNGNLFFCGCKTTGKLANNDLKLKCGWKNNPDCGGLQSGETCTNPFSSLGGQAPQKLFDEQGRETVPKYNLPPQCELRIPPAEDSCQKQCVEAANQKQCVADCEYGKAAERTACLQFAKVQAAASQMVYLAKQIYNNTDPLSGCLFLKNCKSQCSLRFGEVSYTITLLDIVSFFTPVGALTVVQKIVSAIAFFKKIMQIAGLIKSLIAQGSSIIDTLVSMGNTTLQTGKNIFVLGSALQNLGVKWSDVLVLSPAAMAAGQTEERLGGAANGFLQMIDDFSDNMMNYQTTKAQSVDLADKTQQGVKDILQTGNASQNTYGFWNEKELGFLFTPSSAGKNSPTACQENEYYANDVLTGNVCRRQAADAAVADFQTLFIDMSGLLNQIADLGVLITEPATKRGYDASCEERALKLDPANSEKNGPCRKYDEFNQNCLDQGIKANTVEMSACQDKLADECVSANCPEGGAIKDGFENQIFIGANDPQVKTDLRNDNNNLHPQDKARFDYTLDSDLATCHQWYGSSGEVNMCVMTERVMPREAAYDFRPAEQLLTGIYIQGVIESALYRRESGLQKYLDYNKTVWKEYWEQLAAFCRGYDWVQHRVNSAFEQQYGKYVSDPKKRHQAMLAACEYEQNGITPRENWPDLQVLASLDNDYRQYHGDDPEKIDASRNYMQKLAEYEQNPFRFPEQNGAISWFSTFKNVFAEISDYQTIFRSLDTKYIKEAIDKALDKAGEIYRYNSLDQTKGQWRLYWENLARALRVRVDGDDVNAIVAEKDMKDAHIIMIDACVEKIPALVAIAMLDNEWRKAKNFGDFCFPVPDSANVNFLGWQVTGCDTTNFEKECGKIIDGMTGPKCVDRKLNDFDGALAVFYQKNRLLFRTDTVAQLDIVPQNIEILKQQNENLKINYRDNLQPNAETQMTENNINREKVDYGKDINPYWQNPFYCTGDVNCGTTIFSGGKAIVDNRTDAGDKFNDRFPETYKDDIAAISDWDGRISKLAGSVETFKLIEYGLSQGFSPKTPALTVRVDKAAKDLETLAGSIDKAVVDTRNVLQDKRDKFCNEVYCLKEEHRREDACSAFADYWEYKDKEAEYEDFCPACQSKCESDCQPGCRNNCQDAYGTCKDDAWNYCLAGKRSCGEACLNCYYGPEGCSDTYCGEWGKCKEDRDECYGECDSCCFSVCRYDSASGCSRTMECGDPNADIDDFDVAGCQASRSNNVYYNLENSCKCQNKYRKLRSDELTALNRKCGLFTELFDGFILGSITRNNGTWNSSLIKNGVNVLAVVQKFKDKFAVLQNKLKELRDIWWNSDPAYLQAQGLSLDSASLSPQSDMAAAYLKRIILTRNIARYINNDIMPGIKSGLGELADVSEFESFVRNGYQTLSSDPQDVQNETNAINRTFLGEDGQGGILGEFNAGIQSAQDNIVKPIESKMGNDERGCPDGIGQKGFLNRVNCLETKISRDLQDVSDNFIPVAKNLEKSANVFPQIKENLNALKPEIRSEDLSLLTEEEKSGGLLSSFLPWQEKKIGLYAGGKKITSINFVA